MMKNVEQVCDEVVKWLRSKVEQADKKGLIFGLSGGVDSSVVAALSKRAFPENTLGLIMPCHSNKEDEKYAHLIAEKLNINVKTVDLSSVYDEFISKMDSKTDNNLAQANVKPRLRMITLYYFAQLNNYLVAGSGNKSEATVGYFTKYGDGGVDIAPIGSFVKREVREMARFLEVPEVIIAKPPTAGLWENQTDEKEMGFSYDILDDYILYGKAPENFKNRIDEMNKKSEHKRKNPEVFTLDNK